LLSGYAAIHFLLGHLRTHGLRPFSYYCWLAGLAGLVLSFVLR
jgi:undecaprenyl pyrophosphate phosphatase UppP